MSTQVTLTANQSAYFSHYYPEGSSTFPVFAKANETIAIKDSWYYIASKRITDTDSAFLGFPAAPTQYSHRVIEGALLNVYMEVDRDERNGSIRCYPLTQKLDESSIQVPQTDYKAAIGEFDLPNGKSAYTWYGLTIAPDYAKKLANLGAHLMWSRAFINATSSATMHSSRGVNPPQLIITFGDNNAAMTITSTSPTAGARLTRNTKNTFYAKTGVAGLCLVAPTAASGTFRWRETGSTEVHELPVAAGASPQVVVPSDTFTSNSIDYQFVLTSTAGNTVTSSWVTVSLIDTISSARAVSPANAVVDGSNPATFVWEHINESGAKQTKADLQISKNASTWAELITVSGSDTTCDVPAGSMTSGTWYWRVRTYNLDGVAGNWSDPAMFIAVSSPSTPIIIVTSSEPRPTIQWQTSEQEAYELELGGVLNTVIYSSEKTWHCTQYLSDGSYTIRVRSQNQYGLWSQWGEAEIAVTNSPGELIALTVATSHEASLNWVSSGYDFYLVYRDNMPIAKTSEQAYIDRWSAGDVSYQVRGCYNDSAYYGLSNAVEAAVLPETIMIASVEDKKWLPLDLSDAQHRTTKRTAAREIASLKIAGCKYPSAEPTGFYSHSISVSCAFFARQDCQRIENLLGRMVCVKIGGDISIGYISSMTKTAGQFYSVYEFDVPQIDFREEIDLDTGDIL